MRELLASAKPQQQSALDNPGAGPEASRRTVRPALEVSQRPNASRHNRQPGQSRRESRVRSNRGPPVMNHRAEEPAVSSRRNDPPRQPEARPAISNRLGARQIGQNDARHRIELLERDAQQEEEGAAGPACFGHRIPTEQFPKGFTLPRDTPKYNGSIKPVDWLTDYMTAVGIAGSSQRVVVSYAPLML